MTHIYPYDCAGPSPSLAAVGALAGFMTLSGGKVIDGTACYDSIAFNELWHRVTA
jgi:hypothetical protein